MPYASNLFVTATERCFLSLVSIILHHQYSEDIIGYLSHDRIVHKVNQYAVIPSSKCRRLNVTGHFSDCMNSQ